MKVYLNETQAEVGIVAALWTKQDMINAKKRPNGWIKDNYYLDVTSNAPTNSSFSDTRKLSA